VNDIEWHVITGSKGGSGKTLFALLLLIYFLKEKGEKGSTMLVDLNSMNPDSSMILRPVGIKKCSIKFAQTKISDTGTIATMEASSILGKPYDFIVGRTVNPFGAFNPELFADLLSTIKDNAKVIAEKHKIVDDMGKLLPLKHVIIDTNYHFCNLFSQNSTDYARLTGENLNIYFMWVYGQLERFICDHDDSKIMNLTACAIENNLKSYRQGGDDGGTTPFLHVFNPVGLISSNPNKENKYRMILEKALFGQNPTKDFILEEFVDLEKCNPMDDVDFETWVKKLKEGHKAVAERNNDPYFLLIDIVRNAIRFLNRSDINESISKLLRPKNVIPLSVYHSALQEFTGKKCDNPLSQIHKMDIYSHLLDVLRESFAAH